MPKETYYFAHDYTARNDPKLINLQIKHGMAGIGCYWCIVEMLYEQDGEIPNECERIAFALRTDVNIIQSIINEFGLFKIKGKKLSSDSVFRRLSKRSEKSLKARESANNRWNKISNNANVLKNDANALNNDAIKERKEKESNINTIINKIKNLVDGKKATIDPQILENAKALLKDEIPVETHNQLIYLLSEVKKKSPQAPIPELKFSEPAPIFNYTLNDLELIRNEIENMDQWIDQLAIKASRKFTIQCSPEFVKQKIPEFMCEVPTKHDFPVFLYQIRNHFENWIMKPAHLAPLIPLADKYHTSSKKTNTVLNNISTMQGALKLNELKIYDDE